MKSIGAVLLVFVLGGCSSGANPLIGSWTASITPQTGVDLALTMTLAADGALTFGVAGAGACTGSLQYTGLTWTSTDTTFTTAGTASCTGSTIACSGGNTLMCSSTGPTPTSCTYQLSGNTLVLSGCPSPNDSLDGTYTRQ